MSYTGNLKSGWRRCQMNRQAEEIKQRLTMREVAEHYGFQVNHANCIRCPFHAGDRQASLHIYPGSGGFHCFGCGAHGSVIDFVMRLFDLNFRQALLRINQDFSLGLTGGAVKRSELSLAVRKAQQEKRDAERREQEWWEAIRLLWYYRDAVELAQPVRTEESIWIHPIY